MNNPEQNTTAYSMHDTLVAVKARLNGDYDNEELMRCGPLTGGTVDDCLRIIDDCFALIKGA